jgi:3-phosphoshikimate 1-carboxyvinyltransferase
MRAVVGRVEGVRGELIPPPSKFFTQFSVALATVSEGRSEIRSPLSVGDTVCLLTSVEKLGGAARKGEGRWVIWGTAGRPSPSTGVLDAKNSATSLSLLSSISALAGGTTVITGDPQLRSRPLPELLLGLRRIGVSAFSTKENDSPPFVIMRSSLRGGKVWLATPDKYLSSLILPCLFGEKEYRLVAVGGERLRTAEEILKAAGVSIKSRGSSIEVPKQMPRGFKVTVPRDADLLAPFAALAILTDSRVQIRGEGRFLRLLKRLGLAVKVGGGKAKLEGPQRPKPVRADLSAAPEFFPLFCVLACFAEGTSVFFNLSHARRAKSDRVSVMVSSLQKMGAKIEGRRSEVLIRGPRALRGCEVDAGGDPCTAAALLVAGALAEGKTTVRGVESLRVTYPNFLSSLRRLGVEITLIS